MLVLYDLAQKNPIKVVAISQIKEPSTFIPVLGVRAIALNRRGFSDNRILLALLETPQDSNTACLALSTANKLWVNCLKFQSSAQILNTIVRVYDLSSIWLKADFVSGS